MRYPVCEPDLRKVTAGEYAGAATLVLKGGERYFAPLHIRDREQPLSIISEGAEPAVILAKDGDGVLIENCANVSLSGVRVIGAGFRRHPRGIGVHIKNSRNISISGVESEGFDESGIAFDGVKGLRIYGCLVHDNGFSGIGTTGPAHNEDVFIQHCRVYDQGGEKSRSANHSGNGIMLYHTHNALVEYCDAAGNGWAQRQKRNNGPVGIWCATDCENIVFRDCIARLNRTQPGGDDGGGFDFDGGVVGSYMEYCYSYKNEGSGCLHCEYDGAGEWRDNEARYCALIGDAWRVPAHGEIVFFSPPDHDFSDARVARSLIIPALDRRAIKQLTFPKKGEDWHMRVSECAVLETESEPSPDVVMEMNVRIPASEQTALLDAAPLLTEPRAIRDMPLYSLLEKDVNAVAEAAAKGRYADLFGEQKTALPVRPRFRIDLTGMDTAGCDNTDGVKLLYDSLLPGVCTRLGGGDHLISPMPAMKQGKTYTLRATVRLVSPSTIARLEATADGETLATAYFHGNAGEYASAEVCFECTDDRLYAAAVRVLSENGEMNARDIEVYEGAVAFEQSELGKWRRHGDVWTDSGAIVIKGGGAYASRESAPALRLKIRSEGARGAVFGYDEQGTATLLHDISADGETIVDVGSFARVTVICYECSLSGWIAVE